MGEILKPLQMTALSPQSSSKVKGAPIGICLICGEISTGKHYGVVACLGCKTFFRRAVVQRQDVICKRDAPCDTSHNARKACRACRYRKCLETGMSKEALQPRRDLIGCRRINRPRKQQVASPVQPSTSRKDEMVTLIDRLTAVDETIRRKKFEIVRAKKQSMNLVEAMRRAMGGETRQVEEHCKMEITLANDITHVCQTDLLCMLEWFHSLPIYASLPPEDRILLIKRFSMLNLILEHGYFTASSAVDDVWLISNGTCMPRSVERLQQEMNVSVTEDRKWRQEKLYQQMTDCCIDEVAAPLRRLKLMPQEVVVLKIIMLFNYRDTSEYSSVSEGTRKLVGQFRDHVVESLFAFYESINYTNYPERFGNVILTISGVTSGAAAMLEGYQIMRLFKIVPFDHISEELLFTGLL